MLTQSRYCPKPCSRRRHHGRQPSPCRDPGRFPCQATTRRRRLGWSSCGLTKPGNVSGGAFQAGQADRRQSGPKWCRVGCITAIWRRLFALVLSRRRWQTRLVWSIRCSEMDLRRYGVTLRLAVKACTLLSRWPDLVTANSAAGLKSHLALGYRPRRAEVVANGIEVDAFKPDATTRRALRQELGIDENRPCLHISPASTQ